jgi:hypothetical protein
MATNTYPGIDGAHRLDRAHRRLSNPPSRGLITGGWTSAHSTVARFLGECFAAGAVLGVAAEMARPIWGQRHG